MEPPATVNRNQGAKIPDKREKGAGVWDRVAAQKDGQTFARPLPAHYDSRQGTAATWRVAWASIGLGGGAGKGTPDIDRREEKRIRRYRRERTGSALVSMEVGIRAELGSAEMSMLVAGCWSSKRLP